MDTLLNPNELPALMPPAGVIPNFVNPYSVGEPTKAAMIILIVAATSAFVARISTKVFIMKEFKPGDCKQTCLALAIAKLTLVPDSLCLGWVRRLPARVLSYSCLSCLGAIARTL